MNISNIETEAGLVSHCTLDNDGVISTSSDFLDLLMSCPATTVAINSNHLAQDFFDLKTGLAGEFLQKVSNYRRRLIILGSFGDIKSKSLRDFVYESNKTGQVVFVETLEAALTLLK